jgi:hypothetical protein
MNDKQYQLALWEALEKVRNQENKEFWISCALVVVPFTLGIIMGLA